MVRSAYLAVLLAAVGSPAARAQDKPAAQLPNGVYAVLRDSLNEKDVLPLKEGETLVVDRHKYQKNDDMEPPRFLAVRTAPDVSLDLDGAPKAERDGDEVLSVQFKLKPAAAAALERLSSERLGKHVAIVVGGEVATMHKLRQTIKGGELQITSCAPGAANHLLVQLQFHGRTGERR